jgi:hypothetical protein
LLNEKKNQARCNGSTVSKNDYLLKLNDIDNNDTNSYSTIFLILRIDEKYFTLLLSAVDNSSSFQIDNLNNYTLAI